MRAVRRAVPELTKQAQFDALHLATALEIRDELDGLVTYDGRIAEGARALGLVVLAPA